jgi:hypothetical protein
MALYNILVYANCHVVADSLEEAYEKWENYESFGLDLDEEAKPITIEVMEDYPEPTTRQCVPPDFDDVAAWCLAHDYTLINNLPLAIKD